jgi:glycosyltransferase involved in cell wall biosynthesis
LREAITRLLNCEKERRKMGKRARDYVEAYYALPIIAQKYHRMLQQGFEKMFMTGEQPI